MTDFTKVLGQAYIDMLEAKKKKMDPVDKSELSGEFDDREDQDIDNDGDSDSSDKYLHKKRQTVSKAVEKEKGKKAMEESVVMTENNKNTFNNLPNKVSNNLRHDADRSGHIYAGKHGNKYSDTLINHDHVGKASAIHAAVKKQNPHLSADEHKSLGNAIHKDLKANVNEGVIAIANEYTTFADYAGYKLQEKWEVVQENEDGTFDAFINGELHTNLDEEKAKEIKHKNVAAVQPEGQEKLDQKDETGKQMADDMRKNMDTIDNPETAKQDGANTSQAPKRGGENRSNEPMKSVAKTQGQ